MTWRAMNRRGIPPRVTTISEPPNPQRPSSTSSVPRTHIERIARCIGRRRSPLGGSAIGGAGPFGRRIRRRRRRRAGGGRLGPRVMVTHAARLRRRARCGRLGWGLALLEVRLLVLLVLPHVRLVLPA